MFLSSLGCLFDPRRGVTIPTIGMRHTTSQANYLGNSLGLWGRKKVLAKDNDGYLLPGPAGSPTQKTQTTVRSWRASTAWLEVLKTTRTGSCWS